MAENAVHRVDRSHVGAVLAALKHEAAVAAVGIPRMVFGLHSLLDAAGATVGERDVVDKRAGAGRLLHLHAQRAAAVDAHGIFTIGGRSGIVGGDSHLADLLPGGSMVGGYAHGDVGGIFRLVVSPCFSLESKNAHAVGLVLKHGEMSSLILIHAGTDISAGSGIGIVYIGIGPPFAGSSLIFFVGIARSDTLFEILDEGWFDHGYGDGTVNVGEVIRKVLCFGQQGSGVFALGGAEQAHIEAVLTRSKHYLRFPVGFVEAELEGSGDRQGDVSGNILYIGKNLGYLGRLTGFGEELKVAVEEELDGGDGSQRGYGYGVGGKSAVGYGVCVGRLRLEVGYGIALALALTLLG